MMLTVVLILGVLYNTAESACKSEDTLSEAEKAVLKAHNDCRAKHQDTSPLCYSDSSYFTAESFAEELANSATSYSYTQWAHSVSDDYGENLFVYYGGGSKSREDNWKASVEQWYEEIEYWNNEKVCKHTGHYTQIIWKATKELNCGYNNNNNLYHAITVCQYYPPGNVEGQYETQVPPLKKVWRDDKRCGKNFDLDIGGKARCNLNSAEPCCGANGKCGGSDYHCGSWREDNRCGSDFPLAFGEKPSECNPNHPKGYTCCSNPKNGVCGNTRDACKCSSCTDYAATSLPGQGAWTQKKPEEWKSFHLYDQRPLEVQTESRLGSNDIMDIRMQDGLGDDAGGFEIKFSDPPKYRITLCTDFTDFPVTLPRPSDKIKRWKFTKEGRTMTVYCAGQQVLIFDLLKNPEKCTKGKDTDWQSIWDKKVVKIAFFGSAGSRYRKAQALKCQANKELCADRDTCIHPSRKCDGYSDCPKGTDEEGCKVWRDDGLCGDNNILDNGFPAQCDKTSQKPCCVNGVCIPGEAHCGEVCIKDGDPKGEDYRGTIAVTKSGLKCQRWDDQWPNIHTSTASDFPNSGMEENYCRNPDNEPGPWCYNDEGIIPRFELCNVPKCD